MSSTTFSLSAQAHITTPSGHSYKLCCKSPNSSQTPKSISVRLKPNRPTKPSSLCTRFSHSPSSVSSNSDLSVTPQKNLQRILVEKFVGFVIGSVIFAGCFNVRGAIALPAPTSSYSNANLEEGRDKSEDEELYEKILEKEPRNVEALKVVLYGKMRRGKTKEAVRYVEKLIDMEPDEVEWRLLLALCYEIMGQLSTAKRLFKEILVERPLLVRALHGLALVMHKNHEGPAVFEMLNKALEVARHAKRVTEERNIKILIAQMHVVMGELEEALQKFQDLIDEDHRDFRPYLCQGEFEETLEQFQDLVKEDHRDFWPSLCQDFKLVCSGDVLASSSEIQTRPQGLYELAFLMGWQSRLLQLDRCCLP
nr:protein SLOW GREEN 1, chloroplastic [Ziziphus jujuba var. spinosa]